MPGIMLNVVDTKINVTVDALKEFAVYYDGKYNQIMTNTV